MQAAFVLAPAAPAATTCMFFSTASASCKEGRMKGWLTPLDSSRRKRALTVCRAQQQQEQADYVVYDEKKSVFPAEACEEVGGDACDVDGVGPEVKAKASPAKQAAPSPLSGQDREYVDYKEAKTVFPGEACDELGGEFCEPEYQSGVFPEKAAAK